MAKTLPSLLHETITFQLVAGHVPDKRPDQIRGSKYISTQDINDCLIILPYALSSIRNTYFFGDKNCFSRFWQRHLMKWVPDLQCCVLFPKVSKNSGNEVFSSPLLFVISLFSFIFSPLFILFMLSNVSVICLHLCGQPTGQGQGHYCNPWETGNNIYKYPVIHLHQPNQPVRVKVIIITHWRQVIISSHPPAPTNQSGSRS